MGHFVSKVAWYVGQGTVMLGACNHSPSIPPFLQRDPQRFHLSATQHLSLAFSSLLLLLSRPTLSHIFGFAYPAYASYKAAKGDDPDLHRQWLMFWCVDICQTTAPHVFGSLPWRTRELRAGHTWSLSARLQRMGAIQSAVPPGSPPPSLSRAPGVLSRQCTTQ